MKKVLVLGLALLMSLFTFSTMNANSATKKNKKINAKVETRRVPKGTRLRIQLLDYISTNSTAEGTMFNTTLLEDEKIGNAMILPAGTIIRGYVKKIKPAKMTSKGAVMYLQFDHVVLPSGSQLPLKAVITGRLRMTADEGIYMQSWYGDALKENWKVTKQITVNATNWGLSKDGAAKYCLTPIGAIGGVLGSTGYIIGDSVVDIFRKGKPVEFNKDDILQIVITQDLDVPVL